PTTQFYTLSLHDALPILTSSHGAGAFDVVITNVDRRSGSLLNGYAYVSPNQPPQVNITASTTSGIAPVTVGLTANASDPDGSITDRKSTRLNSSHLGISY